LKAKALFYLQIKDHRTLEDAVLEPRRSIMPMRIQSSAPASARQTVAKKDRACRASQVKLLWVFQAQVLPVKRLAS
jgi:hypothetical protein